jgi:hypothetical protein
MLQSFLYARRHYSCFAKKKKKLLVCLLASFFQSVGSDDTIDGWRVSLCHHEPVLP